MDLAISNDDLGLVVTTMGGSVWRFFAKRDGAEVPLFRAPPPGTSRTALQAGCFPLVPFGNRVRDNRFEVDGTAYALTPNMPWDRHYLHGDGWTSEWSVAAHETTRLRLALRHRDGGTPYSYDAEQSFTLEGATMKLTLAVTNRGDTTLPFGLGWHPYFPLTPRTTLTAASRSYWDEDESWLPTVQHATAGDLDFRAGAPLPRRWVNTAFEGWDGQATIRWPEHDAEIAIDADPLFGRSLVFVSDPAFDPGYRYDFFCFEPMSHSVDAHHAAEGGGLRRLASGESLEGGVRFTLRKSPHTTGRPG
ncbi:aldose 1-epimerase [Lichenifustis flavocetrariae]|uniref:Aldose 1-epimerase n=1 Tax=Lichenifustis flavocetrariae TaxID=2949735 RepID=A0AA41YZP2_9HYPH|nr:aldose 1-epimerase [Lichenifustis flavocetrariae]MCW6507853.1 aldose 1-epimerase [Lichenifustis flavocetrariae]